MSMAAKRTQQESVRNTIGAVMVQQVCVTLALFLMSSNVCTIRRLSGARVFWIIAHTFVQLDVSVKYEKNI